MLSDRFSMFIINYSCQIASALLGFLVLTMITPSGSSSGSKMLVFPRLEIIGLRLESFSSLSETISRNEYFRHL